MSLNPILVELKPAAATDESLYTANIGQVAQGTIFCLNQDEKNDMISVALVSNGNVLTSNCYICYETVAYYGQSIYLQEICLGSEDSINVRSENGTSTFMFTGYKSL